MGTKAAFNGPKKSAAVQTVEVLFAVCFFPRRVLPQLV